VSAGSALVLAAGLVWHSSYAGFSDATAPWSVRVGTGTLSLTDDDTAVSMFTATGIKPGATGTRCIAVSSSGSPAVVRLYGKDRASSNGLAAALTLTVSVGTGGSSNNCNGFAAAGAPFRSTLAGFPTGGWSAGIGQWATTGAAATTRVYQVTWSLPADAPNNVQAGTARMSFVWEARTA
jgi:hypothetical protein